MSAPRADFVELRRFGLSLPEAIEEAPWGHCALKVRAKNEQVRAAPQPPAMSGGHGDLFIVFLSNEADEELSLSVKLPVSRDFALIVDFAEPTGYGLGRSGWVTARCPPGEEPDLDLMKRWLLESYKAIAPKKLAAALPELDAV